MTDITDQVPEEVRRFIETRAPVSKERTVLDMLEEKHVLTMIEFIDSRSPVIKKDIYAHIGRSSGMNRKLEDLKALGLIETYSAKGMCIIAITDKGRKVAAQIRAMAFAIDNWEDLA